MITKNSIENLKNNIDIVDTISQFLEIKKSGSNFKACCPFHGEKTASFVISPSKQIYHCFGCGVGGDSIKFVREYEKLSYPEALEKLASMNNITLEYDNKNEKRQDTKILEAINFYYKVNFSRNNSANDYMNQRGISKNSIEKFQIGYSNSSNETINYFKSNFLNINDGIDLGVIGKGENGIYARFIQRVIFPIYTLNNQLVGFGGRTISGHSAKYINSPQTKFFNKSKLLYGYQLAKDTIYKKASIIITEGYLDVIMLHQAGFNQSVATLGTALTKDHLPLLKRGEPKVILAYDGDNAGINAAYKASLLLSQSDFTGGVVIFKDNQDPADMVKDNNVEELNNMFNNPKSFIPFVIDFLVDQYDVLDPSQKNKILININEYLKTLSPIYQEEYVPYISSKLNINQKLVKIKSNIKKVDTNISLSEDHMEISIIKYLLEQPNILNDVLKFIDSSMFEYHSIEFDMLINDKDNTKLRGYLLNDKIKSLNNSQLDNLIFILLSKSYDSKITKIKYDENLTFRQKSKLLRDTTNIQKHLKSQKFIS